jgi:hypothetical protein
MPHRVITGRRDAFSLANGKGETHLSDTLKPPSQGDFTAAASHNRREATINDTFEFDGLLLHRAARTALDAARPLQQRS